METIIALSLLGLVGYVAWNETMGDEEKPPSVPKRLCDYVVRGGIYEEAESVIQSGRRLLEVHLYSDENGNPIVSKNPLNQGYDYAYDYWTFDSVCVSLIQAFPNRLPFILSIVPHTTNTVTLNKAADCLKTTVHRHLVPSEYIDLQSVELDLLADKLIIVSGGIQGTELGDLVNLSWNDSNVRRLTYGQAVHPHDYSELIRFNRNAITLVTPDPVFGKEGVNPEITVAYGCQWILYGNTPGFVEKASRLQ